MADDRTATEPAKSGNGGRRVSDGAEFAALRRLLVGPEQHRLDELTRAVARHVTAEDVAEHLPEAIRLRAQRDRQIGRALAPTVETALRESIRHNRREIATALFPVLGPAIRKAIAETMAALVRSINSALEYSFSPRGIRWRFESWRTGVPYAQVVIKHALVYRVEQAFLVHAESGLLLAHVTAPAMKVPDADLISGMLTAIQDFVRDAFRPGEAAMLRTFTVGDHTVQVEVGPCALLALIIRGEAPPELVRKQQDTLETIHTQYAVSLTKFNGDATPFGATVPLLEECLETVLDTSANKGGRVLWMHWAIPAAAVFMALVAVSWWSRVRFARALSELRAEPGLVVVDARRRWRDWTISGLRDPQARAPAAVLAEAGLMPRALLGQWKPYLSLDSAVVVTRARQMWGLDAGSTISVRGDTLHVAGEIPLGSVRRMSAVPPGVAHVVTGELRLTLPPPLEALRDAVNRELILFARGSASLTSAEEAKGRLAALRFRTLQDSIVASSAGVLLTMSGRTDPTGSDERNEALAQWRLDRVAAIFAAAGVRPEALRRHPLGTIRPLEASGPAERARVNRSVSFEITISARPAVPGGK